MKTPLKIGFEFTQLIKIFGGGGCMLLPLCSVFILFGFILNGWVAIFIALFGCLGLVFFVPLLFFLLIALITQKPALIISEEGMQDNSQLYGGGFIKWEEIEKMTVGNKHTIDWLSIELYDVDLLVNRSNPMKRMYLRTTEFLASTSMQIDMTRLNISGPKLLEAIEEYSNGRFNDDNITASNVDEWSV